MRGLLILFWLVVSVQFAHGHNPNVATFSVRKISKSWVLVAEFSKEKAFESLQEMHGDSVNLATYSNTEMKQDMVAYIKKHVEITVNDSVKVVLGAGGIKMEDGHVQIILQLQNLPDSLQSFEVFADAFSENSSQNNIFVWGEFKFVLNPTNKFRVNSIVDQDRLKKVTPEVEHVHE